MTDLSPIGNECQCPSCVVIFTSPRAFDVHQVHLGKGDESNLVCLAPDDIGMVARTRRGGTVWSFDSEGEGAVRPLR